MVNTIAFPGLSIGPLHISETFEIFGVSIHLYGLIIAIGILTAYFFCSHIVKEYNLTKDNALDLIIFGLPSAVICARIYYVIFEWGSYKDNLLDIFKIWEGGIAIYGAIIGACISSVIYCKVKKINPMNVFDLGAFGLLLGQMIGRWGNFVNAEAYGAITNVPWRMELIDLGICVHPTFLYESLWNFSVFVLLVLSRKKTVFSGENFLRYITLYGLGRFWIEGLRTDSLYLGDLRISQIVALGCVICGTLTIIIKRIKLRKAAE